MASMKALCKRGIVMQKGSITFDGSMSDGITNYLKGLNTGTNNGTIESVHRTINTGKVYFRQVTLENQEFLNGNSIYFNHNISLKCQVEFLEDFENVLFDVRVNSADGIEILNSMNIYDGNFVNIKKGLVELDIEIENKLQPGKYFINLGVHMSDGLTLDYLEHILEINVLNVGKDNQKGLVYDFKLGYYRPNTSWKIKQL
jgi:lipopolysaccharide transport system ATP-binding protein